MIETYYGVCFLTALLLTVFYVYIWHKHLDVHITLVFMLVPINNLGSLMLAMSRSAGEAILAQKVVYLAACFLPLMILLAVLTLCNISLRRWARVALFLFNGAIYVSTLTMGSMSIFYKSFSFKQENGAGYIYNKEYGFMHTVFYFMVIAYFAVALGVLIYSFFKKNQVSRKILYLLLLPEIISIAAFFGGRKIIDKVELVPAAYCFALVIYLIIIYRISIYDITDTAIDSLIEQGDTGFISCDFKFCYLGSNTTAKQIIPELKTLTVDKPLSRNVYLKSNLLRWLNNFKKDESKNKTYFVKGNKTYLVVISYLFDGRHKRGYQLVITDDTKNQQNIRLINSFNTQLKAEVAEKTADIIDMHNKLILGMATMVESRDNSTGGHIKRTSEVVRMLIDEMKKDSRFQLTEKFCSDMIKAAPMHDLGKIAVDDAILRKPGRFTPEEYEKMKTHAAEGARIVHEILKGTSDFEFHILAENVAHYHHERWDGSGYPDGLKGTEIPFEARIMAVADVYDALVSKRVYKEKMSFKDADAIIMEGMGKHFDLRLKPIYAAARPKLEKYYSSIDAQ
ncbi:putative two-component system response regulator [Ruminococcaceae bacterium FB2012]|nr:putative two-component system response regulator [Ruminococcaceae bacterium FB2012]